MKPPSPPAGPGTEVTVQGNLLGPGVRRDVSDLNRQFLGLCLAPELGEDARFQLPRAVTESLRRCPAAALDRIAACPFTLFTLSLPPEPVLPQAAAGHVADARRPSLDPGVAERCQTFLLIALAVGRRIAEGGRLSARIAMGVASETEARLAAMAPSELAAAVSWPGLVRPRWARHERFWAMLTTAATQPDGSSELELAFCVGLCLPDPGERPGVPPCATGRRKPR